MRVWNIEPPDTGHNRMTGKPFGYKGLIHPENGKGTGELIEGKGIYAGQWQPKDLSALYDIYVTPEDPKIFMTFKDAVEHVAWMPSLHGYHGADFSSEAELYEAIQDGRHEELEKWFIPPVDMLEGIYRELGKGELKNMYLSRHTTEAAHPKFWSITKGSYCAESVKTVDLRAGHLTSMNSDEYRLGVPLVRAELAEPAV